MYGTLSTFFVLAAVIYLYQRMEPRLDRALDIAAERVGVYRQATVKPAIQEEPMPKDFVEWAMNESETWAQEAKLARMRELYDKFNDWEKVRQALMAEEA